MIKTLMNSSYQILHHMGIIMEMDMVIVMEMEIMGMTQIMNLKLVKVLGYMHIPMARKRLFRVWSNKTSSSFRTTRKMLRTLSLSSNSTL